MKGTVSEVYVTVELGKHSILDNAYQNCDDKKYAIFLFKVTCESDPRYHLKYLLLNTDPFKAFDYNQPKIRAVYAPTSGDDMFMQALTEIINNDGVRTCQGWWASKEQIEKFESLRASSRV